MFRVKLGIDINTGKQVAIKIMRVKQMVNKRECLECLFQEINILTECRHPNVVKILDCSFDGTYIKEEPIIKVQKPTMAKKAEKTSPIPPKKAKNKKSSKETSRSGGHSS